MKKNINILNQIFRFLRLAIATLAFLWVFMQLLTGGQLVEFTNLEQVSRAFDILVLLWLLTVTRG